MRAGSFPLILPAGEGSGAGDAICRQTAIRSKEAFPRGRCSLIIGALEVGTRGLELLNRSPMSFSRVVF